MKSIFFKANVFIALVLVATSCMKDDIYSGPATIEKITYAPSKVTPDDEVQVTANISDLQGVTAAEIHYRVNGGEKSKVGMTKGEGDTYTGIIPKQVDKAVVKFSISAQNKAGATAVSEEQTYTVGAIPIPYENLVLNELNGHDKFIEIFNKGTEAVLLKGVYIQKDGKSVWTAPENQSLAVGAYLLLYSINEKIKKPEHPEELFFEGGLSAKKAVRVQLFSPSSVSLDDFNLVNFEKVAPASYSRWENGSGKWVYAAATPGAANVASEEAVSGLQ